ncbi:MULTISPECIES: hypothetical protein [unclassified Streptomyces]|uniref:hypothetical protein n=1 Tax=unclassified Streptomyces TaxID=2593676 RepID=UPI001F342CB2|nr:MULTISPECIES: hypothetical protein [unclassified Streptomyces]
MNSRKPAASTTATDQLTGTRKLGTGSHWSDTDIDGSPIGGTFTALSYTQPARLDLPNEATDFKNPTWAILEVRVCADVSSTPILAAQTPWALEFPDGSRLNAPLLSGSGVPQPEFPTGDGIPVTAGTCLAGKITFSLEHGTRPSTVVYTHAGHDPIEWAVPKV